MYRLTGSLRYIDDAIARVETFVTAAEAAIAGGGRPEVAGDSYLEVGWYLEQLALAYDAGYNRLTGAQRERWAAFADQTLRNVWNPRTASWGGRSHPWSGWSTCDPGNNYHFSFLRATMLWALAEPGGPWLNFLQTQKFGPLVDYYAQLPGGGSREGTGYGTAQKNLFENYLYWLDSTGENLATLSPHTQRDHRLLAPRHGPDPRPVRSDRRSVALVGARALRLPREPGPRRRRAEPRNEPGPARHLVASEQLRRRHGPQLQPGRRSAAVSRFAGDTDRPGLSRHRRRGAVRALELGHRRGVGGDSSPGSTINPTRIRTRGASRSSGTIGSRSPRISGRGAGSTRA